MQGATPPRRGDSGEVAVAVNPSFGYDSEGEFSDGDMMTASDRTLSAEEKSERWWRKKLSQRRRARNDMERFMKHHFAGPDGQGHNRLLDKLTFLLTVLGCLLTTFMVSSPWGRRLIPYATITSLPLLVIIRYIQYKKRKWHYFLIDFCYWANTAVVLFMLFPDSALFGSIIFAITHSILPWTIVAYRNSLVFHSIDKFTSFYIHVYPMAVMYTIRWYPEDVAKWWLSDTFNTTVEPELAEIAGTGSVAWYSTMLFLIFASLICFFVQQFAEIVFINIVAAHPCAQNWIHVYVDKEYLTLYRHALSTKQGLNYNVINAFGPKFRLTMWMVLNLMFALFTMLPVYIWYRYQAANMVFAIGVMAIGTWNGANFYVEVFSRRYYARRKTLKPLDAPMLKSEEGDGAGDA